MFLIRWLRGLFRVLRELRPPNVKIELRALLSVITDVDKERLQKKGMAITPQRRWYQEPMTEEEMDVLAARVQKRLGTGKKPKPKSKATPER